MEKKLISEIKRIQGLMGVKNLISEQNPRWLTVMIQNTPSAMDNFMTILKKVRTKGQTLTDDEIDDLMILLDGKISRQQWDELYALLKSSDDFKKLLATTDNFLDDLQKYGSRTGQEIPGVFNALAAVKLSPEEIKNITLQTIKTTIDTEGSNLNKLFNSVDDHYKTEVDELLNSGVYVHPEEVFDSADDYFNGWVMRKVEMGTINLSTLSPEDVYKALSERMRVNSKTKIALDDAAKEGKTITTPKKTKTVVYGVENSEPVLFYDEVVGVPDEFRDKYLKLLDKKKLGQEALHDFEEAFLKGVNDFKKREIDLETLKILSKGVDDLETLSTLGSTFTKINKELKWFERFYASVFRPYYRWWVSNFEILFYKIQAGSLDPGFEFYAKKFDDAFGIAFNNFVKNKKNISSAYLFEIKDKLLKLTASPINDPRFLNSTLSLEDLWKNFKQNASKQIKTQQELSEFNEFVKYIENQPSNFRSTAIKDLFDDAAKQEGVKSSQQLIDDINKKLDDQLKTVKNNEVTSKAIEGVVKFVKNRLDNLRSMYLTGTFRTPQDVERYFIQKGGYTSKTAIELSLKVFAVSRLLIPFLAGIYYALADGLKKSQDIKGQKLIVDPNTPFGPYINTFGIYIIPTVIDGLLGKNIYDYGFKKTEGEGKRGWGDILESALPGYGDDTIIELGDKASKLLAAAGQEEGQYTVEQKVEVTAVENYNTGSTENWKTLTDSEKSDIANSDTLQYMNTLMRVQRAIERLVDIKAITEEDKEFLLSKLKFIPEVPNDYVDLVRKKMQELKATRNEADRDELETLTSIFGDLTVSPIEALKKKQIRLPKSVGSVVLDGNGKNYLVLGRSRMSPTLLKNDFDNEFPVTPDNIEHNIAYITPEFDKLEPGGDRIYNPLTEFIKRFKK
jgi:chemotaxis regulatin CheY-phosphate phosphatase CheZ